MHSPTCQLKTRDQLSIVAVYIDSTVVLIQSGAKKLGSKKLTVTKTAYTRRKTDGAYAESNQIGHDADVQILAFHGN